MEQTPGRIPARAGHGKRVAADRIAADRIAAARDAASKQPVSLAARDAASKRPVSLAACIGTRRGIATGACVIA
jgi:hypothetical protein